MADGEPTIRRKFVLMDMTDNHNKEWMVEWYEGTSLMTTSWGRVGDTHQTKTKPASRTMVEDLIYQKERKGYREIILHVPTITVNSPDIKPTTDPRVATFVNLVFQAAGERISQYLAVGIDALSPAQIAKGRHILDEIGKVASKAGVAKLAEDYYNTIPTQLSRRLTVDEVVFSLTQNLSEQEDRLNQLEAGLAMYQAQATGQTNQTAALGIDIRALETKEEAYARAADYILRTYGGRLRIRDLFKVRIPQERLAYQQNTTGTHNVVPLFHGTRTANVRHILRSGLIIPHMAANGSRFGRGIYFANKSEKSINYTDMYSGRRMVFIADVALGNPKQMTGTDSSLRAAPAGYDSVWGTQSHGGMDEFIVYQPSQQTIRTVAVLEQA